MVYCIVSVMVIVSKEKCFVFVFVFVERFYWGRQRVVCRI